MLHGLHKSTRASYEGTLGSMSPSQLGVQNKIILRWFQDKHHNRSGMGFHIYLVFITCLSFSEKKLEIESNYDGVFWQTWSTEGVHGPQLVQPFSQLLQTGWNWKFDHDTLRYDILEQNNCFSGAKTGVAVGFVAFVEFRQFRRFSQKFVSCFNEIQYQEMTRSHL